jgi:hypothetical protein
MPEPSKLLEGVGDTEAVAEPVRSVPRPWPWGWAAAAIHAVVFAPVILHALFRPASMHPSLWIWHAARIPETFHKPWRPVQAHFGWAASSRLLDAVLPTSDPRVAGAIVSIAAAAGFGAALWFIFSRTDDGRGLLSAPLALVASLLIALMEAPAAIQGWRALVTPDTSFIPLYFPFVPTTLASMGLNVVVLWGAGRLLDQRASPTLRRALPFAVVGASLMKPNMAPMLAVVAPLVALAIERRGERPATRDIVRLITIPGFAVGALQAVIITWFSPAELQGTVVWRPFYEILALGGDGWQFWLIGLLPVAGFLLAGPRLIEDRCVVLATATFLLGLSVVLLFARGGETPWKGSVGGDVLQLGGTTLTMLLIFVCRRLVVLQRQGRLAAWAVAILVVVTIPYLVAGGVTYRCHSGLAACYPKELSGTWPSPPLADP